MSYTYYGDLLGIASFYRLAPKLAYERLNDFYRITFNSLSNYCRQKDDVNVQMFSDSLLIWGDQESTILEELFKLYRGLIDLISSNTPGFCFTVTNTSTFPS